MQVLLTKHDFRKADYNVINTMLLHIDWNAVFGSCVHINDYWQQFHNIQNIIVKLVPLRRKLIIQPNRLPNYIRTAISRKRQAWRRLKATDSRDAAAKFKALSAHVRSLMRMHIRSRDHKVLNNVTLNNFYRVVSQRLYPSDHSFPLCDSTGSLIATDADRAKACSDVFVTNFLKDNANTSVVTF